MSHRMALSPAILLRAYRAGLFPMAETRDSRRVYWLDPDLRGVLPLERFHLPRRLYRTLRSTPLTITVNRDFRGILALCAAAAPGREESWISEPIAHAYTALHDAGFAHSIEAWAEGQLVGGLYGVAIGGAFFGESMVSRARDASKLALVHLVGRLRLGGFGLLDTQFITSHLAQFGAVEIPREAYRVQLAAALARPCSFPADPPAEALAAVFAALRQSSDNPAHVLTDAPPHIRPPQPADAADQP